MTSEEDDGHAKKVESAPTRKKPDSNLSALGDGREILVCESCGHVESHCGEFNALKGAHTGASMV